MTLVLNLDELWRPCLLVVANGVGAVMVAFNVFVARPDPKCRVRFSGLAGPAFFFGFTLPTLGVVAAIDAAVFVHWKWLS